MTSEAGGGSHLQDGPTASRPTYRLIQVLRAVAALMVVVHHATIMLNQRGGLPIGNWLVGGSGVDIFFVISGFVMTISSDPLRKARHPARIFLARRLERIVPLYWLMTTLKVVLVLAAPAMAVNALGGWRHVVDSYLFLPGFFSGLSEPVVVVGWTLNFEMAFYALFAAVLAVRMSLLKSVAPVLVGFGLVMPLLLVHGLRVPNLYYFSSLVLEFLFGILLARAVQRWRTPRAWISVMLLLAGFVSLWYTLLTINSVSRGLVWGLPALAIVAGTLGLERKLGAVAPRWLLLVGDASYSIYLVHTFVLPLIGAGLARFGDHWPGVIPLSILVSVCLSAVAGLVLYRVVELPIMRYFKGRRRTAVPAVV